MRTSGWAAAVAALAVVLGAGANSAQAAPISGLAKAQLAPGPHAQGGDVVQIRWRGHRHHRGGHHGLRFGRGFGFHAGFGYPYYGSYYRPYRYSYPSYTFGYASPPCYWSRRLHRKVCHW